MVYVKCEERRHAYIRSQFVSMYQVNSNTMASFNGLSIHEHEHDDDDEHEHEHVEHVEQNDLSLDNMSTGGPLAWVRNRAKNPKYSSDNELKLLHAAYNAHQINSGRNEKTVPWNLEEKKLLGRLNTYKSKHKLPIHTSQSQSHQVGILSKDVRFGRIIKDYLVNTPSHEHDASISRHLDHVTSDYQKLKNSVQRLLKKKMIEFPATTTVGAKLLNIKSDKTRKTKEIQEGLGDETKKRSLMTALLTDVKQRILSVDYVPLSHTNRKQPPR